VRYTIQVRHTLNRWIKCDHAPRGTDLEAMIAKVRSYDEDGLFAPSYRIVNEDGEVVASYKTHAHPK